MKVIPIPNQQHYEYLLHVFEAYTRSGIPGAELRMAAETYELLMTAQEVDMTAANLGKAEVTSAGPEGVALNLLPEAAETA